MNASKVENQPPLRSTEIGEKRPRGATRSSLAFLCHQTNCQYATEPLWCLLWVPAELRLLIHATVSSTNCRWVPPQQAACKARCSHELRSRGTLQKRIYQLLVCHELRVFSDGMGTWHEQQAVFECSMHCCCGVQQPAVQLTHLDAPRLHPLELRNFLIVRHRCLRRAD